MTRTDVRPDLCGAASSPWWAAPLLMAGGALAVIGPLRGTLADTVAAVAKAAAWQALGMGLVALGVAVLARADDLPAVASLSLQAAWLAVVGHVVCRTALLQCAAAVEPGAGTQQLDRARYGRTAGPWRLRSDAAPLLQS